MDEEVEASNVDAGRGRGRGRGRGAGVPVLPEGIWGALNNSKKEEVTLETVEKVPKKPTIVIVDVSEEIPRGFGRGRGFGGGRGRGAFGRGAGGGRGLVRDAKGSDWDCPGCGNVNWCWRNNCNKCNTGKPASLIALDEVRDGRGGGFNERQVRVSAATNEVGEDGFDDFGRKIGKGMRDKRAKETAALARLNSSYGFLPSSIAGHEDDEVYNDNDRKAYDNERRDDDREDKGKVRGNSTERGNERDKKVDNDREKARDKDRDNDRGKDRSNGERSDKDMERNSNREGKADKGIDYKNDWKSGNRGGGGKRSRSRPRSGERKRNKDSDRFMKEESHLDRNKERDRGEGRVDKRRDERGGREESGREERGRNERGREEQGREGREERGRESDRDRFLSQRDYKDSRS